MINPSLRIERNADKINVITKKIFVRDVFSFLILKAKVAKKIKEIESPRWGKNSNVIEKTVKIALARRIKA